MTRQISDKQLNAVLRLDNVKRYEHFLKQVADWMQVWSLSNADGWVLIGDAEGGELVPIWPHARYADVCAINAFTGTEPTMIPLALFLDKWLPGMATDRRRAAVFPRPDGSASVVEPMQLKLDIQNQLDQYE